MSSNFLNIYFNKPDSSQNILLQAVSDQMFAELVLKYFQKTGITMDDQPQFLFNSQSIPYDSCKTLDDLKMRNGAKIDVVIGKTIIGALII